MAVLEAMSAGRPVVATAVGAVPELVADHQTGLLCTPGDADSLSGAILDLLEDRDEARRLGENGYTRAAGEFSAEAMARHYLGVYNRALGRRKTAPHWKTISRAE